MMVSRESVPDSFNEGYDACKSGVNRGDCPYPDAEHLMLNYSGGDNYSRHMWLQGWDCAYREVFQ